MPISSNERGASEASGVCGKSGRRGIGRVAVQRCRLALLQSPLSRFTLALTLPSRESGCPLTPLPVHTRSLCFARSRPLRGAKGAGRAPHPNPLPPSGRGDAWQLVADLLGRSRSDLRRRDAHADQRAPTFSDKSVVPSPAGRERVRVRARGCVSWCISSVW